MKDPKRKHPAHGVQITRDGPTIVYLTICTKERDPWLATPQVHAELRDVWQNATAWLVGRYMIMPDHIHFFASLGAMEIDLDRWVRYWKSQFSKCHQDRRHRWETDHWDTRMRTPESYEEKWHYVCDNPARHKLVPRSEDWPFQGEIFELLW